ncbi:MAG: hypothetical protein KGI72_05590 [Patescibacteria group bacterium]|nr:hypothetical protein [Patescibacteria group bacterium]
MSNIGGGTGSSYPGSIDIQTQPEIDSPSQNKTRARAAVPNDLASAVIAVETALGTNPQGTVADVKTFLQTEHGTNGTHLTTKVVTPTTLQNATNIFAVDTGVADAYVFALTPAISSYTTGLTFLGQIAHTNATGTPTANVNSKGAVIIVRNDTGGVLFAGDLQANGVYAFFYDGIHLRVLGNQLTNLSITAAQIANATITQTQMANASIGQNQLKTSTALVQGAVSSGSTSTITMADFSFFPNITSDYLLTIQSVGTGSNPGNTIGKFILYNSSGNGSNYWVNYRYVTASEGLKLYIFNNGTKDICKYSFEDAPPEYLTVIQAMATDNGWTYREVTQMEFDALTF